jgi:moderate conductance mechanosensitive channel
VIATILSHPLVAAEVAHTLFGRVYAHFFRSESSTGMRILLIGVLAVLAHLSVTLVGRGSEWLVTFSHEQKGRFWSVSQKPKFTTFLRLLANSITWVTYFVALGLILEESGVNLTTYLASASVIGLAISFGSQGLVQDMVIGLTLIFSDAMDVDDMVEVVGSAIVIGRVQEIGLRFTKVVNLYDQIVFIPNRTIANVSRFPYGGIYAYADIHLPAGIDPAKALATIRSVVNGTFRQFGAIVLSDPIIDPVQTSHDGGWSFVRVRFKIWPGQGSLIETTFRQQILSAMKIYDPKYADWQVPVFYRAFQAPKVAPAAAPDHAAAPTRRAGPAAP